VGKYGLVFQCEPSFDDFLFKSKVVGDWRSILKSASRLSILPQNIKADCMLSD
jgi:hypothetical protein